MGLDRQYRSITIMASLLSTDDDDDVFDVVSPHSVILCESHDFSPLLLLSTDLFTLIK